MANFIFKQNDRFSQEMSPLHMFMDYIKLVKRIVSLCSYRFYRHVHLLYDDLTPSCLHVTRVATQTACTTEETLQNTNVEGWCR